LELWLGVLLAALEHVFEFIIPQILLEPNVNDPYNVDAADLYTRNLKEYKEKVESNFLFSTIFFFFWWKHYFTFSKKNTFTCTVSVINYQKLICN
jgi:hypothetical protein